MINKVNIQVISLREWLLYFFISILILGTTLPSITSFTQINFTFITMENNNQKLSWNHGIKPDIKPLFPFKSVNLVEDNPEAYFPNFLYYSVEIANTLIDHLYDNKSGGFYRSADQEWSNNSINRLKYSYDQAQAIIALLKLSNAVINQTEREYAIKIAKRTGKCLITDLLDVQFDGFFISESNRLKKPGVQAKVIQALLSLYKLTENLTYRDMAINTFNFLEVDAWENIDENKGYYNYLLSHTGLIATSNPETEDLYEPKAKRVDHNILMGEALLDLYHIESDEIYLRYARRIYNFFNTTCRNSTTGLFYTGLNDNNEIVENRSADLFINSLVLEFLAHLYTATEEQKYYDDFFTLLYSVLGNFWDDLYGGFYKTYSYVGPEARDKKKHTERQFYAIRALDEAYKLTNNSLYYNLIYDMMEFLTNKLYDNENFGYFQEVNQDGTEGQPYWKDKYAVTQSLAIYSFANLWLYSKPGVLNGVWSPSTPLADQDSVTISVAAFDSDGLSNVLFNYSINNDPYKLVEMVPHKLIGNMFETMMEAHPDGTTVNFNIIVNDTFGNKIVRGSYFFLWQIDVWAPQIFVISIDPGIEIPVHKNFSIIVTAQDVPSQGSVEYVRMYYHLANKPEETISLKQMSIGSYYWKASFSEGIPTPGTYLYYFEAIDNRGNPGFSYTSSFSILGYLETLPASLVFGVLLLILVFIPAGLYTYVEFKKKSARKTLKNIKRARNRKGRGKRGAKRIRSTKEK
ncbi:MAG: AGE family epimerase/isomerase [Promethearchaeota archaeon]